MGSTPELFSPLALGKQVTTNRFVMAPCTRQRATADHVPTDAMVRYYSDRASFGLILSEPCLIQRGYAASGREPGIVNHEQVEGWRRVTDAVHAKGGLIFLCLSHAGRATVPANLTASSLTVMGPSAVGIVSHPCPAVFARDGVPTDFPAKVHAMDKTEITACVDRFLRSAKNAMAAGFDGVQILAGSGYLIDQFLRDGCNKRTDEYGGSIENRSRFLLEVVDAVCAALGPHRVGVRLSPLDSANDMSDSDPEALTRYVCTELSKRTIAFVEVVRGDSAGPATGADKWARETYDGNLIGNMQYTVAEATEALASKQVDAVSFGSLAIANPDLPYRVALHAPLNELRTEGLCGGEDDVGYNDYPLMAAVPQEETAAAAAAAGPTTAAPHVSERSSTVIVKSKPKRLSRSLGSQPQSSEPSASASEATTPQKGAAHQERTGSTYSVETSPSASQYQQGSAARQRRVSFSARLEAADVEQQQRADVNANSQSGSSAPPSSILKSPIKSSQPEVTPEAVRPPQVHHEDPAASQAARERSKAYDREAALLQPLLLPRYTLPNRVIMGSLARQRASETHVPTDAMVKYYSDRAAFGFILSEPCEVQPGYHTYVRAPGVSTKEQVAAWRKVTDAVHAKGGLIFCVLHHGGRATVPCNLDDEELQLVGPTKEGITGALCPGKLSKDGETQPYPAEVHELRPRELAWLAKLYAVAAKNAMAAGFDGVQIHAANGYLIDQFLRDGCNKRTDEYGGSATGRSRFLFEVVDAVVAAVGKERVGVRLSPLDTSNDMSDSDPEALTTCVGAGLQKRRVSFIEVASGTEGSYAAGPADRVVRWLRRSYAGAIFVDDDRDVARAASGVLNEQMEGVTFTVAAVANPDLVDRIARDLPLAEADSDTFFDGGDRGYNDYGTAADERKKRFDARMEELHRLEVEDKQIIAERRYSRSRENSVLE